VSQTHTTLLIIDPQNDFVDPYGSLSVKGAHQDAERLVQLIDQLGSQINSISLSLDSHQRYDISHPLWFFNEHGDQPAPFTIITEADLLEKRWFTRPEVEARTQNYLRILAKQGRYPHVIWPEHCVYGSVGHAIYPIIQEALHNWSARPTRIDYIHKGHNPFTEHFSAVEAEVIDPNDPNTQLNRPLINRLSKSDQVWVAGWARSHCVGNTLKDLFKWGGKSLAQKTVIITDTMSDVQGFESQGEAVIKESLDLGARLADVDQLIKTSA